MALMLISTLYFIYIANFFSLHHYLQPNNSPEKNIKETLSIIEQSKAFNKKLLTSSRTMEIFKEQKAKGKCLVSHNSNLHLTPEEPTLLLLILSIGKAIWPPFLFPVGTIVFCQ